MGGRLVPHVCIVPQRVVSRALSLVVSSRAMAVAGHVLSWNTNSLMVTFWQPYCLFS